jgi:glucose/mannose transport system substrate-binding protein
MGENALKKSWSILLILVLLLFSMEIPALAKDIDLQAVLGNTAAEGKFDVYHWWTAGGEKEAVDSAIAAFNQRYPNIRVISNAIPGGAGGSMVMKVKVLALTGNSPETFQAHPGLELEPYEEAAMLYDLTELWETLSLEDRMLKGISELCQIDGKYYIVPIGVHKTNMVFYNKKMFEEYQPAPRTRELG